MRHPEVLVVGCQPGGPGTAAVAEVLGAGADAVVRAADGPSGDRPGTQLPVTSGGATAVLGDGCAVDPASLLAEIEARSRTGVALVLSEHAPVVLPYHRIQDTEVRRWAGLGPSGSPHGAGPCHEDRIAGIGLRVADLLDPGAVRAKLTRLVPMKLALLERVFGWVPNGRRALFDVDVLADSCRDHGHRLAPYLADVPDFLAGVRARGGRIVHEPGGTGMWAAGIVSPGRVAVVGVTPACTSVTAGRVVGLDLPALRRAVRLGNVDWLCLTDLDLLSGLGDIPVITGHRPDGVPVQQRLPGWPATDWAEVARVGDRALPTAALVYAEFVAGVVGARLGGLGVGRRPGDTILLDPMLNARSGR
ncbi:adenylosuccinate synthetase [Lentzea sp.]|uniref:adenylosuccinate synthetase n=1 Tax=Lentzea sp. TaxID=56099 RepID=UPI002BC076DC|nr:adenylosuccinate synthetase [Lentzea sp.]HUQ56450.1 adenylosuccinate synthetase [Lentzea sp.]